MNHSNQWLISRLNSIQGPFDVSGIKDLISSGRLGSQDFISIFESQEAPQKWQLVSQVAEFSSLFRSSQSGEEIVFCPYIPNSVAETRKSPTKPEIKAPLIEKNDKKSTPTRPVRDRINTAEMMEFEACLFQTAQNHEEGVVTAHKTSEREKTNPGFAPGPLTTSAPNRAFRFISGGALAGLVLIWAYANFSTSTPSSSNTAGTTNEANTPSSDQAGAPTFSAPRTVTRPTSSPYMNDRPSYGSVPRIPSHLQRGLASQPSMEPDPEAQPLPRRRMRSGRVMNTGEEDTTVMQEDPAMNEPYNPNPQPEDHFDQHEDDVIDY